jgi:hypothetical protein
MASGRSTDLASLVQHTNTKTYKIMIIWRGWGILVVLIAMAMLIAVQLATGAVFGDPEFYKVHDWPKGVALLLAAVAVYFAGSYFNSRPGRTMIDKATGREIVLRRVHSLFFVPMQYWGFVLAAFGVVLFFVHVK